MKINETCMACGMCLEICPVNAISIKSSHGYAQCYIDKRVCINCGIYINMKSEWIKVTDTTGGHMRKLLWK
jgi:ferredoxin